MGHEKRGLSLVRQIQLTLESKLAIGQSKFADKQTEQGIKDKIYSWETFKSYMKHCNYFAKWCKENYNCKTLEECRPYADEWLKTRFNLSAYTVKLEVSALAKLYGCSINDFVATPSRHREDIRRSRGITEQDKHFSVENNKDLVEFCRSTGLRRAELQALRGNKLEYNTETGKYYIIVDSGSKGGKPREALVCGNIDLVVKLMQQAGDNKVFGKVQKNVDIHSFRADYAVRVYKLYAREIKDVPEKERYYCRKDLKGQVYDKSAMLCASRALGHNRIDVIAGHYLRNL